MNAVLNAYCRKPAVTNTREELGWKLTVGSDEMLRRTVSYYVHEFYTRERSVYDYHLRSATAAR